MPFYCSEQPLSLKTTPDNPRDRLKARTSRRARTRRRLASRANPECRATRAAPPSTRSVKLQPLKNVQAKATLEIPMSQAVPPPVQTSARPGAARVRRGRLERPECRATKAAPRGCLQISRPHDGCRGAGARPAEACFSHPQTGRRLNKAAALCAFQPHPANQLDFTGLRGHSPPNSIMAASRSGSGFEPR